MCFSVIDYVGLTLDDHSTASRSVTYCRCFSTCLLEEFMLAKMSSFTNGFEARISSQEPAFMRLTSIGLQKRSCS